MSHKLDNYLRSHRKRAGLSQDEVAFLLGRATGTKISRYERFSRRPSLETAFIYRVLFGAPVEELFAGVLQRVERTTKRRVQLLLRRLDKAEPNRQLARKREALRAACSGAPGESAPD